MREDHTSIYLVEGLEHVLKSADSPGLPELRALLRRIVSYRGARSRLVAEQKLDGLCVYRLRFEVDGEHFSVIVKFFSSLNHAQRDKLATTRWLPAAGLGRYVPTLLGSAAEREGRGIWHAYTDVGGWSLAAGALDEGRVSAAVDLIAKVHARFAENRMLGEIRALGGDLGAGFLGACIRDAKAALLAMEGPNVELSAEREALRDMLIIKLDALQLQVPIRTAAMDRAGGVETLVHGDLWTTNVMVLPAKEADWTVVMIDWDRCGVGPLVYDLSTFLLRFEMQHRPWVLDLYRAAIEREAGWNMPDHGQLNELFETCEYARLVNTLLWPAIGASDPSPQWAFEKLKEVYQYIDEVGQVLP